MISEPSSTLDAVDARIGEVTRESSRVRQEATRKLVELEAELESLMQTRRRLVNGVPAQSPGLYPPRRAPTLKGAMPAKLLSPVPATRKAKPTTKGHAAKAPHAPRRRGPYADRSEHPFPKAVGNVAAWAEENDIPISTARSWYTHAHWGRPIPLPWAEYFLEMYEIPHSAWPNGTTEDLRVRKRAAKNT